MKLPFSNQTCRRSEVNTPWTDQQSISGQTASTHTSTINIMDIFLDRRRNLPILHTHPHQRASTSFTVLMQGFCTQSQGLEGKKFMRLLVCDYASSCYSCWKHNLPWEKHHKAVSSSFTASACHRHSDVSAVEMVPSLIQCYLTLLYESIKLMVSGSPWKMHIKLRLTGR